MPSRSAATAAMTAGRTQEPPSTMRIGYFGGTFDPPHRAHLHVARAAASAFALGRVLLAPTGIQPLKATVPAASYADRLAMTKLLCADDPLLAASDIDAPKEDGMPNYTIDALDRVRAFYPDARIYVIAGADSFRTLPQWHRHQSLLQQAEWIVVSRPGVEIDLSELSPEQRARVHTLATVDEDVSSTGIRERLRFGVSCDHLLTATVNLYIARMHLYHTD